MCQNPNELSFLFPAPGKGAKETAVTEVAEEVSSSTGRGRREGTSKMVNRTSTKEKGTAAVAGAAITSGFQAPSSSTSRPTVTSDRDRGGRRHER